MEVSQSGLLGEVVVKNAAVESTRGSECVPIPHHVVEGETVKEKGSRKSSASTNCAKV